MRQRTVRDLDVKGKRVLVRVDYNVPVADGVVGDDLRIRASFDTIHYLLGQGCGIVLMSHLGRPDGEVKPELSLAPVARKASELLGREIKFVDECVGKEVEEAAGALEAGEILLLENLRFHPEEEANDDEFARKLAALGEAYVDDAFAAIHRAHASTAGVTKYLPSAAGLLVEKEVDFIVGAMERPDRPLVAIIGGAKVSTKIDVLRKLIEQADVLMIGGAMANTFYLAQGKQIGQSIAEPDLAPVATELIEQAKRLGKVLILPQEVVVSDSLKAAVNVATVSVDRVGSEQAIVDVPASFAAALRPAIDEFLDFNGSATVVWNGPFGIMEIPEFVVGSRRLAEAVAELPGARTIIGGGDTAALVDELGMHDRFTWVSTGGGASLELMAGKALPGIEALPLA